jgi:hypothetical protein
MNNDAFCANIRKIFTLLRWFIDYAGSPVNYT